MELETDAPVFDPRTVTLMDFDLPLDGLAAREPGLDRRTAGFAYVLPETSHRALVELTFLSAAPFAETTYREALARYLAERHGARRWHELRVERGRIPMDADVGRGADAGANSVTRIGTPGGAVRASSGYAFAGIQRWVRRFVAARANARRARSTGTPRAHVTTPRRATRGVPGSPWTPAARGMDRLFPATIERHPESAPDCFHALFERAAPDALLRFLCDRASLGDRLRVAAALPKAPFARTLLAGVTGLPARVSGDGIATAPDAKLPLGREAREGVGE